MKKNLEADWNEEVATTSSGKAAGLAALVAAPAFFLLVQWVARSAAPGGYVLASGGGETSDDSGRDGIHADRVEPAAVAAPAAADADPQLLFFNRVPKTGTENFVAILQGLAAANDFTHARLPFRFGHRNLTLDEQRSQVRRVNEAPERPASFDRHIHFVDFSEFGSRPPVWYSTVRHPVRKFESGFHYFRQGKGHHRKLVKAGVPWIRNMTVEEYRGQDIEHCVRARHPDCSFDMGKAYDDLTIPYFCGQKLECQILGSSWALTRAKENVERYFPVVGVLEELRSSLRVLEAKLPIYFRNATALYDEKFANKTKNKSRPYEKLSLEARQLLEDQLVTELEFYYHMRQRLRDQLADLPKTDS